MSPEEPARSASTLSISTFGPLAVAWNGVALARPLRGRQAALLAYLATEPGPHRREMLAGLFWPEATPATARLNLRQTLFQLRALLHETTGRDFIEADRETVGLAPSGAVQVGAVEFASPAPICVKDDVAGCAACFSRLNALAAMYVAPFLADVLLPECLDFEEWLVYKRDTLHRRALDLLMRLADCRERQGDPRAALAAALRYVELDPCSEAGHLRAMRLYLRDNRREAALAQYESCCRELERELGVLPNAELTLLAEQIRNEGFEAARVPLAADRRQVTVLYCEMNAIGVSDPDDVLSALRVPQARCAEILRSHGGHIVQAYGGGLLAYFGYPQALENGAVQAVRVARELSDETNRAFSVRVGVHSGLIVTAPESRMPDAIGATSGIAIRLRELAGGGEVVVSAETRRRTAGYFLFAAVGRRRLRGLMQPMEAFKVIGESGAQHRLAAAERLSPFTGRSAELAALLQSWALSRRGRFQATLISGDAGVGKSRLVDALKQRIGAAGFVRELRCFAETMYSPMQPAIAMLAGLCGFRDDDGSATRRAKLDAFLLTHAPDLAERSRPVIASLMGSPDDAFSLSALDASEQLQQATRELLVDLLYSLAARQPVLVVVEDMHWADEPTCELMQYLVERQKPAPIHVLFTARPQWQPAWLGLERLLLAPLPDTEVGALVEAICSDIAPERLAHIVARAEGIPLFAEELAAMTAVAEVEAELPANLHDLLMVRLDALGSARSLAQLAATVGREIDMAMFADLSALPAQTLRDEVARLRHSGLIQEMADGRLRFKHALVQDAAYRSQTRELRQARHRRVAEVIESRGEWAWRDAPELLARHWGAAAEAGRAVPLWLAAGRHAAARFAHREAVTHFEAGLNLLEKLSEGEERDRLEFGLLIGLAQSEQSVAGYGRGRSGQLLADAEALLGRGSGNGEDLFRTVWGLWEGAGSRIDHCEAGRLAHRLIAIAEVEQAPSLLAQGHYALGNSLFWCGEFAESCRHLDIALATLPSADRDALLRDTYGSVVAVGIHVYLSWGLWLQGETERGLAHGEKALTLARASGDAYSLAFALTFAATLQRWQGNVEATLRLAQEGRAVAASCTSAVFEAAMGMTCGWAAAMQGDVQAPILIEQSLNAIRTAMSAVVVPLLAPLAEALLHRGEFAKALPVLEEALAQVEAKQDRHYLAELYRMKGMCLLAQEQREAARTSFETALSVAREQGAVAFERRALAMMAAD